MYKIIADKTSVIPIHHQIKDQIKGLIHAGTLKTGDQLPTIRELSIDLAVNFNTVAFAYRDLDAEGIIVTERGKGTFVATTPNELQMQVIREEKLAAMVGTFINEARRLGYTVDQVIQAIQDLIQEEDIHENVGN